MPKPVLEPAGQGGVVANPVGGDIVFKVRGEQSGGTLTAFETTVAPGEGPPLHTHANEDESLYVIEGEFRFALGDHVDAASAGSLAFVPRGTPHTFQNVGERPARMLIHFTPSGMERFFDAFAASDAQGPEAFALAAAEVGMLVVGPPLALSHPL